MREAARLRDARQVLVVQKLQRAAAQAQLAESLAEEIARRSEADSVEQELEGALSDWRGHVEASRPDPVRMQSMALDVAVREAALQSAERLHRQAQHTREASRNSVAARDCGVASAARVLKSLIRRFQHARDEKLYAALEDQIGRKGSR